jgi:probable F420-dependent oxidoreductase
MGRTKRANIGLMVALQLTPAAGPLADLPDLAHRIERHGYRGIWIGEVNGFDAVVPATLAASSTRSLKVGALFNVYTRAPTNVAVSAAALGHLAPGRVALVLGASSPLLVERWNGIPYERPHARVRDYLQFLRAALAGGRVSDCFTTFRSSGFSLDDPPPTPPEIFIAAAQPRMIGLASAEADGVVLNWVAPHDLDRLDTLRCDRGRIWLSTIVCPSPDRAVVDETVRSVLADYLAAPAYAALQRQVGRGPALEAMWERWAVGDRTGAHDQLPSSVIDELVVSGTVEHCGEWIRDVEANTGIQVIATIFTPAAASYRDVVARLPRP